MDTSTSEFNAKRRRPRICDSRIHPHVHDLVFGLAAGINGSCCHSNCKASPVSLDNYNPSRPSVVHLLLLVDEDAMVELDHAVVSLVTINSEFSRLQ